MPKVLVADDSPLIRRVLRQVLAGSLPCDVLEADDGVAALALARSEHPVVAVLDIQMPNMSGLEVCAQLKADEATQDICVLILTGNGSDDVHGYALSIGADGFYEKPLGTREVAQRVREVLAARS